MPRSVSGPLTPVLISWLWFSSRLIGISPLQELRDMLNSDFILIIRTFLFIIVSKCVAYCRTKVMVVVILNVNMALDDLELIFTVQSRSKSK
jgi:hypothetical protein